jgi:hypothetical protein
MGLQKPAADETEIVLAQRHERVRHRGIMGLVSAR